MKLVCDCGNEMEFIPDNDVDMEDEDYGQFVKTTYANFDFWAEHDQAGVTCRKCDKAIWYFA